MTQHIYVQDAINILTRLGLPTAQQNPRSALTLLALLNLTPDKQWNQVEPQLIGVTPIMGFIRTHYGIDYAPNTRETIRDETLKPLESAGIIRRNPHEPDLATNSPKTAYQIQPLAIDLLRTYGTEDWEAQLTHFISINGTLKKRYERSRQQSKVAVAVKPGLEIHISPGKHSALIKQIIEEFAPRFVPGSDLIYVGDTGEKWGYFDSNLLESLGVKVDLHGKMPDVVFYYAEKNWIILVEAVTSSGPIDGKRHEELTSLFSQATVGLIYITAFPTRRMMTRYLSIIAWETEAWIAENPSHLIHFDGERFLGPYTH